MIRRSVGVVSKSVSFVWGETGERYTDHGNLVIHVGFRHQNLFWLIDVGQIVLCLNRHVF